LGFNGLFYCSSLTGSTGCSKAVFSGTVIIHTNAFYNTIDRITFCDRFIPFF